MLNQGGLPPPPPLQPPTSRLFKIHLKTSCSGSTAMLIRCGSCNKCEPPPLQPPTRSA